MKALVVGAGIGGLAAAAALRRAGMEAEVYEQAPELLAAGTGLAIMTNAVLALRTLGIDLDLGGPGRGAKIETAEVFTARGRLIRRTPFTQICDRLGAPSVCVHRADLQTALLEAAGETVTLGARAVGFSRCDGGVGDRGGHRSGGGGGVRVDFADGTRAYGDVLVGADGINSAVREQLAGPAPVREAGYVCWLATVPFAHPRITRGFNGHYWGRGQRFGLHDIGGGRVYWWGTRNSRSSVPSVRTAFQSWAPEVREVIAATPDEAVVTVPAQDRPFLSRWGCGPVTLLGDAAHPMLTSLAQGGSTAIEDAVVLARALAAAADPAAGLRAYENLRRARARALVEMSYKLSRMEQATGLAALLRDAYLRFAPPGLLARPWEQAMTPPALGPVSDERV